MHQNTYPQSFAWGAATSAYQIEGAWAADGKGESIWDAFCRRESVTFAGHDGRIACDHYRRSEEDVGLMREIGLNAYRFSIAWPRILPDGTGAINSRGLDFYDRLVDALLAAGIQPWATLYHWDLPLTLCHRGGWLNAESPQWFADYTQAVVTRLGDRVRHWITLNEPQCFIGLGLLNGLHAPGLKLDWPDVLRAGHHALLAHGRAVQVLRGGGGDRFKIGWAPVGGARVPATNSPADIAAARQAMFAITERSIWATTWWADPVMLGRYPEDGLRIFGAAASAHSEEEMRIISTPVDFYGTNVYSAQIVAAGPDGCPRQIPPPPGVPMNMYYWPVLFDALHWCVRFLHERYGKPVVVTENGTSSMDWVNADGRVQDPQRIDYLRRQLQGLASAMQAGVPVEGFFVWSLLDNFEWHEGYRQRFGLIHVDFETGRRTLKDSALWYRDFISGKSR